jgi:hypothetical protein
VKVLVLGVTGGTGRLMDEHLRCRRFVSERGVRPDGIVQLNDGTPTGSRSARYCIVGILGLDASSVFMK